MKICKEQELRIFLLLYVCNSTDFKTVHSLDDTIMTSSGPVQGTEIRFHGHRIKQYLGIPFAEPPVGELRFKKPQPVTKQSETIKADTMPPACIQYVEYPFPWYDFQDVKSEDCLYLNIWVPQSLLNKFPDRKVPVMFWIYGGGYTVGSNRQRLYEGQALAAEGKIVVVTINYRLGVFGFLTSGTKAAPMNLGIYDTLEALKWVNKNIDAFGGNPDQVTISGESAGGISVSLLCISPLAKGLFHRVILESGTAFYLYANRTASILKSNRLAEAVGCADENTNIFNDPEEVVNCLRKVDAFKLAKTFHSFSSQPSAISFFPSYGDEILPENARVAFVNGDFHDADVLIGNNRDEAAFMITTSNPDVFGFFGEKDPTVNKSYGTTLLEGIFSSFPNTEGVINHYLGDVPDDDYEEIRRQVYTAAGDYSFLCPDVYFAEKYSEAGNKVYYYFFEHRPSTTPWAKWMGVVHFEEIQFVFGVPLQVPGNYTKAEVYLSKRMLKMWTNFVKYGNPGNFKWPLYSKENPIYYSLSTSSRPKYGKGPHENNCNFFRPYFYPSSNSSESDTSD